MSRRAMPKEAEKIMGVIGKAKRRFETADRICKRKIFGRGGDKRCWQWNQLQAKRA